MKMKSQIEANTLELAGKLIAECHKNTADAALAIAALRVAVETIASSAQVSAGVLPESCSIPASESRVVLQP